MKKSVMAAAVIVIVAIAAVGVGVYLATQGGGGGGGGGGTKNTYTVANATSLQIEGNETSAKGKVTFKWAVKNLNSTQQMMRIDLWGGEAGNYSYIFLASNKTVWSAANGTWTDSSSSFNDLWSVFGAHWTSLVNELIANWSGSGEYTFTAPWEASETIYYVGVNPSLADSLFQPSTP
jgi:hypothetical protein